MRTLTNVEMMLFVLSFFSILAFLISLYILYRFSNLYRKAIEVNEQTIQNFENKKKDYKVVVVGGGTGQSVFLRGIKHKTKEITAVVTVADDGGSSGALRDDLGMLPPGDIRNCVLALANIEPTMNEVMQYRFTDGALKGQNFGNLFIAAMTGIYGNFENAVYKMSQVFAITGKVLPVTLDDINLIAELENGNTIIGESIIPHEARRQNTKIKSIKLDKIDVRPLPEVIDSIKNADIIVIGPGSIYTSILPNLLVDGVVDALSTASAPVVYMCNIMTQPGESDGMNVLDHIKCLIDHTGMQFIDYVIVNNENLPQVILDRYFKDGAELIILDQRQREELHNLGIRVVEKRLIEIKNGYIRHDSDLLSDTVVEIVSNIKQ
ncbi:gluconeogenesis factor YvcK family protein [Peptostreptococcus equinus]|uniref:Putative gluconeogenesis factor n=1 Tax=Peptostreptococcus equinus TaxID=3003601 RepID=A0ABY7JPQ7_9FIRM|nr:gluconeogenesis factor YvcK family protein [Peptostreptococcus sp. CBA3647]WAW15354.1 YvcK family protein [Peptostreptococcus sp. CBA3647]